ncbi:MAG: TetR/AcrR family transcriptional regulator [Rhodospirillaceae bacterium]
MPPIEKKREQILDAAVAEFQQKGFAGASMDRIAERAAVSKRTVYNHFESKEVLFDAIVRLMFLEVRETVVAPYVPGKPFREQLIALGRAEGRLLQSERFMALARMALGETMRAPEIATAVQEESEKFIAFSEFMTAAAADGAIAEEDIDEAANQFVALLKARSFWPYVLAGGAIGAEEMESIVQNSTATVMARFALRD